jgi:2',3'-cyclic-nucleotide 2'-phosphodiesterase (5'-nucleotidase family)
MTSAPRALLLLAAALAFGAGCIDYNEPCKGLTENPDEVVAQLGEEVFLDKANVRHANNAIGQAAADAFRDAPNNSGRPSLLGILNGGALRAEGLCATRNIIPAGPLTNGRLHEILLFNDIVESLDLKPSELMKVMEGAVKGLYPGDQEIASPSGSFLQLSSGAHLEVDCSQPAGSRVQAFQIGELDVKAAAQTDTTTIRVALVDFLLQSGDGFEDLRGADQDPSRNPAQANESGGIDSNLTADYMRAHFLGGSPLTVDDSRVVWTDAGVKTCATPGRPAPN